MSAAPYPDDLEELEEALRQDIRRLAEQFLGAPSKTTRDEWRWGTNGSFRVYVAGPKKGGWANFESPDDKGKPLKFIKYHLRCSSSEAIKWARAWVGGTASRPAASHPAQAARAAPLKKNLGRYHLEIAAGCAPAIGTVAERYLREHRQIVGPLPPEARFHPRIWHSESRKTWPALVLIAADATGVRRIQVCQSALNSFQGTAPKTFHFVRSVSAVFCAA